PRLAAFARPRGRRWRSALGQPRRFPRDGLLRGLGRSRGSWRWLDDPRRNRPKHGVANAIVETDPVDPQALTAGVAIAHLHAPQGQRSLLHIFERALHRLGLGFDAALLPLAIDADVQLDRVTQRRTRMGSPAKCGQCKDSKEKPGLHALSMPLAGPNGNRR